MYKIVLILFAAFISIDGFCQGTYESALELIYDEKTKLIEASELHDSKEEYIILDTRSIEEFRVSHLAGSNFIDYESINDKKLKEWGNSGKKIVVYCTVGYRSGEITNRLNALGFDAQNLYGGIIMWANKGYSLIDSNGEMTKRVHTYNAVWSVWLEEGQSVYE